MEQEAPLRVLLIFSDASEAASVKKALSSAERPVDSDVSGSVAAALDSLVASRYDLAIASASLGDGGPAALAAGFTGTPTIAVGTEAQKPLLEEALLAGAADYLFAGPGWKDGLAAYVHRIRRLRNCLALELDHLARRYEDLVDALPDIIYELDPEGRFSFINQSVRMLGYCPEELVGKHFSVLLYEEDVPHVSRDQILPYFIENRTGARNAPKLFDERRGVDRKTENLEIRLKRRPGSPQRGGDVIASVISYGEIASAGAYRRKGDQKEKVFVGTVGIIRDITLRRKSEDMLRKMYQAVDQSPVAVVVFDHEFTIEYVNPAFFGMTGSAPDQALGRRIGEFLGASADRDAYDDLLASVRSGIDWKGELRIPRTGSDPFWSSISISAIRSPSGIVTNYLCLMEDATGKHALEELLQRAKSGAEDASRAKSEFLSSVGDQLRGPLAGLVSLAESLLADAPRKNQTDRLEALRSAADSVLTMIADVVDLSEVETRAMEPVPEDFALKEFTAATLEPYRALAASKGLYFEMAVEDAALPVVRADRGRIARILGNLASNAVKFTDSGGVSVKASVRAQGVAPALVVSVRDTGMGISTVDQKKLFGYYSQLGEGAFGTRGGFGLGLALSRELAFRLGGDIRVESAPGAGSTFTFFVPVEKGGSGDADESLPAAPQPYRVLLADGNPVSRDRIRNLLDAAGHKVATVQDGYEALAALGKGDFDLVLLDLRLSGLDGVSAAKAVRRHEGAEYDPNIPLVALVSFGQDRMDEDFQTAGFDGYTDKPVNPRVLLTLIDDTVRTKVRFDAKRLKRQFVSSPDDLRRTLMLAERNLPTVLAAFEGRHAVGDLEGAASALNDAVGILAPLGAQRALQLVKRYRKAAKDGDTVLLAAVAGDLAREGKGIRKFLRKTLAEL